MLLMTCAFLLPKRHRRYPAIFTLFAVCVMHILIAWDHFGDWRQTFLGNDPETDQMWLKEGFDHRNSVSLTLFGFYIISHLYIMVLSYFMIRYKHTISQTKAVEDSRS